jgi:hypothetical protein
MLYKRRGCFADKLYIITGSFEELEPASPWILPPRDFRVQFFHRQIEARGDEKSNELREA